MSRIESTDARPLTRAAAPVAPQAPLPSPQPPAAAPARDTLATTAVPARHRDGVLGARDGQAVSYRTSEPADAPKAIVVMQQGTYGQPAFFDGMGEALAARGIRSYAVGSRVQTTDPAIHAADLQRVVELARRENPGVPVTVMGVSLGAAIVLNWSAVHNQDKLPVVAMSPVVAPAYLGLGDVLRIAGGLVSGRAATKQVHSPMSAGRVLTTNPRSPEFALPDAKAMTVPARLFGDVVKMTAQVAAKGRSMTGPLYVAMAGNDAVATNWSTRGFAKLVNSRDETLRTFPGLAHDLSQEWHDPTFIGAISDWVLAHR